MARLEAGASRLELAHASSARVPVEWQALRPLDPPGATPVLFVHLLDGGGRLVRTFDRPLAEGWPEAADPIEIWQSALAEPLPAGSYRLTTGVYEVVSGQRWRLETSGGEVDEGEYEIAAVEVSSDGRTPELAFEGDWHDPEAGQAHNPGRRWMGPSGSIRLLAPADWSEVVLTVSANALPVAEHRPVFDDPTTPRLVLRNGCDGGAETLVEGYGVHTVSLRLATGEDCEIRLEPDFFWLDVATFVRRSVGLESVFFRPRSGASSSGG